MTAVYFVNVLSLLIIRIPRVPGANINEVPNSEKFSHSAGGPQLELRWGPGRAKRARARHTYTKTRKTAKSHLFSELGEMLGNTVRCKKKMGNVVVSFSFLFYKFNGHVLTAGSVVQWSKYIWHPKKSPNYSKKKILKLAKRNRTPSSLGHCILIKSLYKVNLSLSVLSHHTNLCCGCVFFF